jgi:hypothetical protein
MGKGALVFRVEGYVAGSRDGAYYYDVAVDAGGQVTGPPYLLGLLELYRGKQVSASPVGPAYTLDFDDPASVLAALYAHTDVRKVEGDIPAGFARRRPGATD